MFEINSKYVVLFGNWTISSDIHNVIKISFLIPSYITLRKYFIINILQVDEARCFSL